MKIAIIGYGKMGHMIEEVALSRGHEIVATIDAGDAFDLKEADVAIEFTTPLTAKDNILRAWAQGVPVVCGSTGWDAASLMAEDKRIHERPMLIWKSNYHGDSPYSQTRQTERDSEDIGGRPLPNPLTRRGDRGSH